MDYKTYYKQHLRAASEIEFEELGRKLEIQKGKWTMQQTVVITTNTMMANSIPASNIPYQRCMLTVKAIELGSFDGEGEHCVHLYGDAILVDGTKIGSIWFTNLQEGDLAIGDYMALADTIPEKYVNLDEIEKLWEELDGQHEFKNGSDGKTKIIFSAKNHTITDSYGNQRQGNDALDEMTRIYRLCDNFLSGEALEIWYKSSGLDLPF